MGPCPPWNDELARRYIFTLYALSVLEVDLHGPFDGRKALKAIENHVLVQASAVGMYTLNPRLTPKQIGALST